MVIMTAKVSKRKILLIGLLIILAVVVLITCLKKKSSGSDTPPDTTEEITEVATNEARVAFLEQFGWRFRRNLSRPSRYACPKTRRGIPSL